jgi:dienelactone hydrolase
MRIKRSLLVLALLLALPGLLRWQRLEPHAKTVLLLSEVFPQIGSGPLPLLTGPPTHQRLALDATHGTVVADLFLPGGGPAGVPLDGAPAIVIAVGVQIKAAERPRILALAESVSRLGYVAIWPRREALDRDAWMAEDPETFIAAFRYLAELGPVDRRRISIVGFSVGASIGFVAAADPRIAEDVHAVVFFGGYHDALEYFVSLATRSMAVDGRRVPWTPHVDAIGHARELFRSRGAEELASAFDAETPEQAEAVLRSAPRHHLDALIALSPSHHVEGFRARIFILHDEGDQFVPYVEAAKLNEALASRVEKTHLLVELFGHVQPAEHLTWSATRDVVALYGFVHDALHHLGQAPGDDAQPRRDAARPPRS